MATKLNSTCTIRVPLEARDALRRLSKTTRLPSATIAGLAIMALTPADIAQLLLAAAQNLDEEMTAKEAVS